VLISQQLSPADSDTPFPGRDRVMALPDEADSGLVRCVALPAPAAALSEPGHARAHRRSWPLHPDEIHPTVAVAVPPGCPWRRISRSASGVPRTHFNETRDALPWALLPLGIGVDRVDVHWHSTTSLETT